MGGLVIHSKHYLQRYYIGRTAKLFVIGPFLQFQYMKLLLTLNQPYICKCHFISRKKNIVKKSPFTYTSNQRIRFYTTKNHHAIFTISHQNTLQKKYLLFYASISISYSTINQVSLKIQIG